MALIGMLHHRKDPIKVRKAFALATVAKAEGVEFFYFSPRKVDFSEETILGYEYENGEWVQRKFPFPDVIYNTGDPEKMKKAADIIRKLQAKIPFTSYSVSHKIDVYEKMKKAGLLSQYFIPSQIVEHIKIVYDFLNAYEMVLIKPLNILKGRGIVYIQKLDNNRFAVMDQNNTFTYNETQLNAFIDLRLQTATHFVQQSIFCKTKSGLNYDYRIHVQRNGEGNWVISTVYPRVAPLGSFDCNISSGAATNYLEPFLRQEFGDQYYDIKQDLESFALILVRHLDEINKESLYTLHELAIDVGLDQNHKLWLYDVNWRPSAPPSFYLELDEAKNTVLFAAHLAKLGKQTMENSNEAHRSREIRLGNWSFHEISLKDMNMYDDYAKDSQCPTNLWSCNFAYLWASSQSRSRKTLWKIVDGMLVNFAYNEDNILYLLSLPVGSGNPDHVVDVLYKCMTFCYEWNRKNASETMVKTINETQLEFLRQSERFDQYFRLKQLQGIERHYGIRKLISLQGKEFEEIRRKLNKFRREYPEAFIRRYTPNDYPAIKRLNKIWKSAAVKRYDSVFDNVYFRELIKHWDELNHIVLVVEWKGEIIGIVAGGLSSDGQSWASITKGMMEFNGLSEFMSIEFVHEINRIDSTVELLNVGSDLGSEGLRRFKDKFKPILNLTRYRVYLKK